MKENQTMTQSTRPIPDTYRRITPCLVVDGAAKAIDFYTQVFSATERMRFPGPDGTIAHAEIEIGDSVVIIEDASPHTGTTAPPADGLAGSPVFQFIYVDDVDATVACAVEFGGRLKRAAQDQFYGDRDAFIIDPFGHGWTIASHVEDVSAEEMGRRLNQIQGQPTAGEEGPSR
ncbi:VOC family protein [Micromonospora musae]|nr:VOC family protein [Micromonospora musae]